MAEWWLYLKTGRYKGYAIPMEDNTPDRARSFQVIQPKIGMLMQPTLNCIQTLCCSFNLIFHLFIEIMLLLIAFPFEQDALV